MRRLITSLAGLALIWAGGFVLFLNSLPAPSKTALQSTDGVAVYTGGGGVRISAAMAIFADGGAKRLLISGVHPDTSLTHLGKFWVGPAEKFECCVDLGREALTTRGNAEELTAWTRTHNFDSVILVTSDYHMPRALAETKTRIGEMTIKPFAVRSDYLNASGRPSSIRAMLVLAGEYSKLLLTKIDAIFSPNNW